MTPEQIRLVQDSFSKVIPIAPQAAQIFYETLFTLDPSLKGLFKGNMKEQQFKLMASLQMIVLGLEKPKIIINEIKDLAIRHVYYNVKEQHYDTVGKALITTLEKGLGADFAPEVRKAWEEAYKMISTIMIQAAREV